MKKPLPSTNTTEVGKKLIKELHDHERFFLLIAEPSGRINTVTNMVPEVGRAVILKHLAEEAAKLITAPELDLGDSKVQ